MTTKQEQTSTEKCVNVQNQSVKVLTPNGENQPAQNGVGQSTSAEISAHPNSPAKELTSTISGLKARYSKGGIMYFPSEPVKRDKERFTFKDCKAWNIFNAECVDVHVLGNIDPHYTGCAVLSIPDDPHPWNAFRSVIDQFYQRERVIAWERYETRVAIKKAQQLEEKNKQLYDARGILDSRIGELKKALALAEEIGDISLRRVQELEDVQPAEIPTRLNLIDALLQQSDAGEWVENISEVLDCIITLAYYDEANYQPLRTVRALQEFFMKLDKATRTIAEQS